jgi:hypothetical protein
MGEWRNIFTHLDVHSDRFVPQRKSPGMDSETGLGTVEKRNISASVGNRFLIPQLSSPLPVAIPTATSKADLYKNSAHLNLPYFWRIFRSLHGFNDK